MDYSNYLSKIIDKQNNTYMHILAEKLNFDEIKKLSIKNKTDAKNAVKIQNINGQTPLHCALDAAITNNKNFQIIDFMIDELSADPSIPDKNNRIIVRDIQIDKNNKIQSLNNIAEKTYADLTDFETGSVPTPLPNIHTKNVNKFSGNHIDINMNSQGSTDNIANFVDQLINIYAVPTQAGGLKGVSGRRKIGANVSSVSSVSDVSDVSSIDSIRLSDMNTEAGLNANSFSLPKSIKNNLLSDFKNFMAMTSTSNLSEMSRMRMQRDPKLMDVYKSILAKIAEHLKLDEADAKLYGTILKIVVGQKNPELKKPENDEIRLKEIEKIVETKSGIEDALAGIDIEALKVSIKERMAERQKKREEYLKKKAEKSDSTNSTNSTESTEPEEKPAKKTAKKTSATKTAKKSATKSKVTENGYLMSDEIIFSPGY